MNIAIDINGIFAGTGMINYIKTLIKNLAKIDKVSFTYRFNVHTDY